MPRYNNNNNNSLVVAVFVVAVLRCPAAFGNAFQAPSSGSSWLSHPQLARAIDPTIGSSVAQHCAAMWNPSNNHVPPTVYEDRVPLPDGASMQVYSSFPSAATAVPPPPNQDDDDPAAEPVLLFLHGSFHGAWCWREHFFPYFVHRGYIVVAPSWRGTEGTPAGEGVKKVQMRQHVNDLHALLEQLPSLLQQHRTSRGGLSFSKHNNNSNAIAPKPVVICHSFGGLAVMKYLELHSSKRPFRAVVTICSVPPSGNGKMTMRFLRRSLVASWRITAGFAMKKCLTDATLCRQLFFGGEKIVRDDGTVEDYGVSDEDIQRYQGYFARDSAATIDLFDLARQLPSATTISGGRAAFVDETFPPCLVMGASDDYLVDREGLDETARYFVLDDDDEPLVVDSPHDVMLGRRWENAAHGLHQWLQENVIVTNKMHRK